MNQTETKCIKNRLKVILDDTNYPMVRPTDQQLRDMNLKLKRFTSLKLNNGKEMTMSEAVSIADWLQELKPGIKPWELFDYN